MKREAILKLIGILAVVAVIIFVLVKLVGNNNAEPDETETPVTTTRAIEYEGQKYFPRSDVQTVLVLGIDDFGEVQPVNSYYNRSQCDFLALLIIDEASETYSVLELNRDTMVDVRVLGVNGRPAGTRHEQLALAHTFGTGVEDSCENTVATVSSFLYDMDIDYYVSFNMDAVGILTDAVGGVTVNVTDDFSDTDPTIVMGEVTLNGEHAINFVRARKSIGEGTNLNRIERQKEFVRAFLDKFMKGRLSARQGSDLYEDLMPYMVTDCSSTVFSSFYSRYSDYTCKEIISMPGEATSNGRYIEFYADEEQLLPLILRLLYAPKKA